MLPRSFFRERFSLPVFLVLLSFTIAAAESRSADRYDPSRLDPIKIPWAWTELRTLKDPGNLRCLEIGPDGTLWLGFNQGVSSHDGQQLTSHPEVDSRGLRSIVAASDRHVYVTAARTLWRGDGKRWRAYPRNLKIPSPSDMGVREDPHGQIWIAANSGLFLVGVDELAFKGRVAEDPISDFDIDGEGRFWVVESPSGTVRSLRREGDAFVEEQRWPGLMRPSSPSAGVAYHVVFDVFCARDGSVWVANGHGDVAPCQLLPGADTWRVHDLVAEGGTHANGSISQTSDGLIRIMGMGTIHRFADEAWDVYSNPSLRRSRDSSYLKEAPDGSVWFLERFVRVSRIDYEGEKWRVFEGLIFGAEAQDGSRWFLGDGNRVVRHDVGHSEWMQFGKGDGLIDLPSSVLARSDGCIWILGSHGGVAAAAVWDGFRWERRLFPELGAYIGSELNAEMSDGTLMLGGRAIDSRGKNAARQPFVMVPLAAEEEPRLVYLPSILSLRVNRLSDGRIAVCGDDIFLWEDSRFQSLLGEARRSLRFERIQNFVVTGDGDVWISNWSGGVARLKEGEWTYFGEEKGLSSRYVADLILLEDGELAALTPEGLDRFDGQGWYSLDIPGIQGISGVTHLSQTRDGAIWLNIENGYWETQFTHQATGDRELKTIRYLPGTSLPDAEVELMSPTERNSRTRVVAWRGSDSVFEGSDRSLSYSYRLDGEQWTPFSGQKSALLQNLRPGERRIEVRARDEDGNTDPTPAVLEFEVKIPYWETRWFIATTIAVAIAIAVLVYGLLWQRVRHVTAVDRMRLRFLTSVSHELRSPLMLIMAPLEKVVSASPAGSGLRKEASMALRNAGRLNELIDQLLELRKIEVEPRHGPVEPCELIGFARTIAADLDTLGRSAGQRVEFCSNVDSVWLDFDKDAYRKILDNLILNALKHSDRGAVTRVEVLVEEAKAETARNLRLTISDEGEGISKEALPHVFELFYVGKSSALPGARSFGVGLALVRDLVELNGGRINVESPVKGAAGTGGGACFVVSLSDVPLSSSTSESPDIAPPVSEKPAANVSDRVDRPLILVVDDHEEIRTFLSKELRGGYDVIEAANGEEALRLSLKEIPDLVLADVMMPRLSGVDLCRRLQESESTRHIPIVLQSAFKDEEACRSGLASGAVDFVAKPFSMSTLKVKIANLLNNRDQFAKRMKIRLLNESDKEVANEESVFIERVQKIIEKNVSNPEFNASKLGSDLGLGKSSCYRKFMETFNLSPSRFLKNYRLEKSIAMLEEGITASEVALRIGYLEPNSYNRAFKSYFGYTPANFKKVLAQRKCN